MSFPGVLLEPVGPSGAPEMTGVCPGLLLRLDHMRLEMSWGAATLLVAAQSRVCLDVAKKVYWKLFYLC